MKKVLLMLFALLLFGMVSCAKVEKSKDINFTEDPYIGFSRTIHWNIDRKWDDDVSNIPYKFLFTQDGIYDKDGNWILYNKVEYLTILNEEEGNKRYINDIYEGRIFGFQIVSLDWKLLYSGVIEHILALNRYRDENTFDIDEYDYIPVNLKLNELDYNPSNPRLLVLLIVVDEEEELNIVKKPENGFELRPNEIGDYLLDYTSIKLHRPTFSNIPWNTVCI
jgi:hypothetical protein